MYIYKKYILLCNDIIYKRMGPKKSALSVYPVGRKKIATILPLQKKVSEYALSKGYSSQDIKTKGALKLVAKMMLTEGKLTQEEYKKLFKPKNRIAKITQLESDILQSLKVPPPEDEPPLEEDEEPLPEDKFGKMFFKIIEYAVKQTKKQKRNIKYEDMVKAANDIFDENLSFDESNIIMEIINDALKDEESYNEIIKDNPQFGLKPRYIKKKQTLGETMNKVIKKKEETKEETKEEARAIELPRELQQEAKAVSIRNIPEFHKKGTLGAALQLKKITKKDYTEADINKEDNFNLINLRINNDLDKIMHFGQSHNWDPKIAQIAGEANVKAFENSYNMKLKPSNPNRTFMELLQNALINDWVDPMDPDKKKQRHKYIGSGKSTGFGLYENIYLGNDPTNVMDKSAKEHDIEYAKAGIQKYILNQMLNDPRIPENIIQAQKNKIYEMADFADSELREQAKLLFDNSPSYELIASQVDAMILLKRGAEYTGLIDFIDEVEPLTPKEALENMNVISKNLEILKEDPLFKPETNIIEDAEEGVREMKDDTKTINMHFNINELEYAGKLFENLKKMGIHTQAGGSEPEQKQTGYESTNIGAATVASEIDKSKPQVANNTIAPITGTRNLAAHINIGDNGDVIALTEKERRNNLRFFSKYMWVAPTNANQQLLPYEISANANNSLVALQERSEQLSLGGGTYNGDVKIQHRIVPNVQQRRRNRIIFYKEKAIGLRGEQHMFLNGPQRNQLGEYVMYRETGQDFMSPREKINNIHQRLLRPIIFNQGRV
jgi:hypothetical protein